MEALEQNLYLSHLLEEAVSLGIGLSEDQAAAMLKHLSLVIEVNKRVNLTRITDVDEAITLHIVDSVVLRRYFPSGAQSFLDIGTGAGFPGIPLAIATGAKATLIDATRKKCDAVASFVAELGLENCTVINMRAEELAKVSPAFFDVVVARAVAAGATIVEYAAPLLAQGGQLILAKGRIADEEAAAAIKAGEICGLENVSRETFDLPKDRGMRTVMIFKKVGEPKIKLPRNVGMAQHHPLA